MERDEKGTPVREENQYKHTDATQESINKKFTPLRLVTWVIAILFILSGIIWLGYAVGLLAAAIPGTGIFEGWIWGMLGLVGVVIALVLVFSARS